MKKLYTTLLFLFLSSSFLTAQVEGTWIIAPEAGALAVGPELGDFSWWSNSADDVNLRACYFDDQFVFNEDGSFQNVLGDETWLEGWQGVAQDECGAPVAPHDGSAAATWSYNETEGTLTLEGVGAYLGLPKVINGSEITNPADAPASITYPVSFDGERMIVDINFGAGYWHYVLERGTSHVQNFVEDQFTVFPNPANGLITIQSAINIDQLIIRDAMGRQVQVVNNLSTNEVINISDLTSGFYLLESRTGNQRSIEKLMVD